MISFLRRFSRPVTNSPFFRGGLIDEPVVRAVTRPPPARARSTCPGDFLAASRAVDRKIDLVSRSQLSLASPGDFVFTVRRRISLASPSSTPR